MDDIKLECIKLNQMIYKSKEYKNYIHARNALKANPELYNSIQEFKARYSDVLKYTEGNPYDEILKMYYENDELIHNSLVSEYLRTESAFSKLLRNTINQVIEGFNFNV